MDVLNTKLWEKYQHLKKRKAEELEAHPEIQENVAKYQRAAEERIEVLASANDELRNQLFMKEEEYAESKKLLMEERRKTKELSMEIERLYSYANSKKDCLVENGCNEVVTKKLPEHTPELGSRDSHWNSAGKRLSKSLVEHGNFQNGEISLPRESCEEQVMPDCCKGIIKLGDKTEDHIQNCVFQTLLESIIGLKFDIDGQADLSSHFSVIHQSSGYSFKLTWLPNTEGDGGEWFYQVSSLGTLERVALEWMEDIVFSSTMFPFFFQRISRVLGRVL